jgi:hypothetical protein
VKKATARALRWLAAKLDPTPSPSTWLELEDVIEHLPGFKPWEREAIVAHARLVRANSLKWEREKGGAA